MKTVCVYCGSNVGIRGEYAEAARQLARYLAAARVGIVYGGASRGIMGILADEMLAAGGEVVGVIPEALKAREIAHGGLTELHVVNSMHERKALMAALSDAFVALPGGFGTLEEIVEMLTWAQLGIHEKPCALLNVLGYFDSLLAYLDHAVAEGFLRPPHRQVLVVAGDAEDLMRCFEAYRTPAVAKWLPV